MLISRAAWTFGKCLKKLTIQPIKKKNRKNRLLILTLILKNRIIFIAQNLICCNPEALQMHNPPTSGQERRRWEHAVRKEIQESKASFHGYPAVEIET